MDDNHTNNANKDINIIKRAIFDIEVDIKSIHGKSTYIENTLDKTYNEITLFRKTLMLFEITVIILLLGIILK